MVNKKYNTESRCKEKLKKEENRDIYRKGKKQTMLLKKFKIHRSDNLYPPYYIGLLHIVTFITTKEKCILNDVINYLSCDPLTKYLI